MNNIEQLLMESTEALNEAQFEISRWCRILEATPITDKCLICVCVEALAAWNKKHEYCLSQISYLNNSTQLALH
nr:hypothetical protein [Pantoea dispersa]